MKVAVIIPAQNEERAISKVIADIPNAKNIEIIVVDNDSKDNTAAVAIKSGAKVVYEKNRGYGNACLAGINELIDHNVIVFLDGDFSDNPRIIPKFLNLIEGGQADMVIGSRLSGNREKGALPFHSLFGNWLAAKIINILFGIRITDLGPFRAIKKSTLIDLNLKEKTYGFPTEMIVKAAKKGYKIMEIPVDYRKRIGKSKISGTLKGSFLAAFYIFYIIFGVYFGKK